MLNEDPNRNFHWRNKLEDLKCLPDETFNEDIAWDKLHGRLRGKRGNKKFLWYWVAAACVLFVCMVAWMGYHKTGSKLSRNETAVKQPEKTNVPNSMADENKKIENINTDLPVRYKAATSIKKLDQRNYSIIAGEAISKIDLNDIHVQAEPSVKPLQILDTNSSVSVILPAKKKLNVVHINELGDPVVESPDITRNMDKHSFKFKLANGEVVANSSVVVSKTTGFTFLKTKPPSN